MGENTLFDLDPFWGYFYKLSYMDDLRHIDCRNTNIGANINYLIEMVMNKKLKLLQ